MVQFKPNQGCPVSSGLITISTISLQHQTQPKVSVPTAKSLISYLTDKGLIFHWWHCLNQISFSMDSITYLTVSSSWMGFTNGSNDGRINDLGTDAGYWYELVADIMPLDSTVSSLKGGWLESWNAWNWKDFIIWQIVLGSTQWPSPSCKYSCRRTFGSLLILASALGDIFFFKWWPDRIQYNNLHSTSFQHNNEKN